MRTHRKQHGLLSRIHAPESRPVRVAGLVLNAHDDMSPHFPAPVGDPDSYHRCRRGTGWTHPDCPGCCPGPITKANADDVRGRSPSEAWHPSLSSTSLCRASMSVGGRWSPALRISTSYDELLRITGGEAAEVGESGESGE